MPLGANVSNKAILSKDESRLHQLGKRMLLGVSMGYVLFMCRRRMVRDLLIASCEDLENLSASDIYIKQSSNTKKSHKKERCRFHVRMDLSSSSIFLDLTMTTGLLRETSSKIKQKKEHLSKKKAETHVRSMSGDFVQRHHEVDRSRFYVPNEETCHNSVKIRRRDEADANKH